MVDISLDDLEIQQKLNPQLPIAFIIHGLNDHGKRQWIQDMAFDYARYFESNVCGVNWSPLSINFYTVAARSTDRVAEVMAKFIKSLVPLGFPLERVTLVGHSMGAHISGMIGHRLKGKVGKIIGLDPAGPYFTTLVPRSKKRRLDKSSARFVQAIHTDKTIIGTEMNLGHQDFYPSGGATPQPGCFLPILQPGAMGSSEFLKVLTEILNPDVFFFCSKAKTVCSHFKAVEYFFYSLNPANRFVGVKCPNYGTFTSGACDSNRKAQIGLYDSFTETGVFYLEVSPLPPFALGG
jgi:pimeloyl-ACP methyl ester carboxylesterase